MEIFYFFLIFILIISQLDSYRDSRNRKQFNDEFNVAMQSTNHIEKLNALDTALENGYNISLINNYKADVYFQIHDYPKVIYHYTLGNRSFGNAESDCIKFTQLCISYFKLNKEKAWKACLEKKFSINKDKLAVLLNIGNLFYENKSFKDAVFFFEMALKINPKSLETLLCLYNAEISQYQLKKATVYLDQYYELNDSNDTINKLIIDNHFSLGNYRRTEHLAQKIQFKFPNEDFAYCYLIDIAIKEKNSKRATEWLNKGLANCPDSMKLVSYDFILKLKNNENNDDVLAKYHELSSKVQINLLNILVKTSDFEFYEKIIVNDTKLNIISTIENIFYLAEQEIELQKYEQKYGADFLSSWRLASIYSTKDDIDNFLIFGKKAFAFDKDNDTFNQFYTDGLCYFHEYEEGKGILLNLLEKKSNKANALQKLGYVYWQTNEYGKSIECFKEVLLLEKNHEILIDLAFSYSNIKDFGNAENYIGLAHEVEPDYYRTYVAESFNEFLKLNLEYAEGLMLKALTLTTDKDACYSCMYDKLGLYAIARNEREMAKQYFHLAYTHSKNPKRFHEKLEDSFEEINNFKAISWDDFKALYQY